MLPKVNAAKPAVEWASAWPLATLVSGAGAAISVVMGTEPQRLFHCNVGKVRRAYSPASGAYPSLNLRWRHAKTHKLSTVAVTSQPKFLAWNYSGLSSIISDRERRI